MKSITILLSTLAILSFVKTFDPDYVKQCPGYVSGLSFYSGYLNTADSNRKLHYVYSPSESNNRLVLWLNGGPGCSSMLGWLQEHGLAVIPDYTTRFEVNNFSWNKIADFIYLESPAGVGFSYTDNGNQDLASDDTKSAVDNLNALLHFFEKFPELKTKDFYIAGESYAGIYVPTLAQLVLKHNLSTKDKINLKGIIIGNGVADWDVDVEKALIDYAYEHHLYSDVTRSKVEKYCGFGPTWIDKDNCISARKEVQDSLQGMDIYDIYRQCPPAQNTTNTSRHQVEKRFYSKVSAYQRKYGPITVDTFNPHKFKGVVDDLQPIWPDPCAEDKYPTDWLNRDDVKEALHVRKNITYAQCSDQVSTNYTIDPRGSLYLYPQLIESGLKIWFYSGDTDAAVPLNGSQKWIEKLGIPVLQPWDKWVVGGQTAGFYQVYSGLTLVTVRGTGHMAPQWKRQETYAMIHAFLDGKVHP